MPKGNNNDEFRPDFGFTDRTVLKTQVVGIFDLVGFSSHNSNDDLVAAVSALDTRIQLGLGGNYHWGERAHDGWESDRNGVLLRSTGDGYVVAFSQDEPSLTALQVLLEMHKGISKDNMVNLGINLGENYVRTDLNGLVNIIGWGINYAGRALQFAQKGQIICTEYLAKPLIRTHGDKITEDEMVSVGKKRIKEANIELFNYYRKGQFGAPLKKGQK